jgi:7-cyano-7-deazaguanine synthase
MDSATVAAVARRDGYAVHGLSISYGQRHAVELEAAKRVAAAVGAVRHVMLSLDLTQFGGSALTDAGIAVPKGRSEDAIGAGVPVTYVPARNTIFLSLALAWAETLGAQDIFVGVNALDYSGYPDCRPEFIQAFEVLANVATAAGTSGKALRLHAPLQNLDKAGIAKLAAELGVDLGITSTCYDPAVDGGACGSCDACLLRAKGFREAGLPDPTRYAALS